MAWEMPGGYKYSPIAGADLRTSQFRLVKYDGSGRVVLCSAITDIPVGVLQNKPDVGHTAEVMTAGFTKIVGGADLAVGDFISTDTQGRAIAAVHGTNTTVYVVGRIDGENTAAGGICTARINCMNVHRAA